MIPNCKGCEEEFGMACELVKDGYYVATTKSDNTIIGCKGHFCLIVVDDNGKYVCR